MEEEEQTSLIENLTLRRTRLSIDSDVDIDTEFSQSTKTSAIKANVMCSDLDDLSEGHFLILDVDYPVEVLKSSSGNSHLIFGKYMTKEDMLEVVEVLGKHGVVQKKWADSARSHGYATLRLPGVSKYNDHDNCGLGPDGKIESEQDYSNALADHRQRQWEKRQALQKLDNQGEW